MTNELVNLVTEGGIAGFDVCIILYCVREARFYLTKTPEIGDYVAFTPKAQLRDRIEVETKYMREIGEFFLKRLIPMAFIISLLVVGFVLVSIHG